MSTVYLVLSSDDSKTPIALESVKQVVALRVRERDLNLLDEGPDNLVDCKDVVRMLDSDQSNLIQTRKRDHKP